MTAPSSTSSPTTFDLFGNATSSPASAAGPTRSISLDSPKTETSGPPRFRVSRFRSLDSGKEMRTQDISGPLFTASSPSAALQGSLESRLRALTDGNGSPEFALTWQTQDMPAGAPICRLAPSARRTAGNVSTGAPWPTPQTHDVTTRGNTMADHHHYPHDLSNAVIAAAWPTPNTPNGGRSPKGGMSTTGMTEDGIKRQVDLQQVARQTAAWATPKGTYGGPDFAKANRSTTGMALPAQAAQAAWPTPQSSDSKVTQGPRSPEFAGRSQLIDAARFGTAPSGGSAPTGKPGALNPEFVCWLQGYPPVWNDCAPSKLTRSRK